MVTEAQIAAAAIELYGSEAAAGSFAWIHVKRILEAAEKAAWQPIETAPKDKRIILWVCTRGSLRRGHPEICWWGEHPDFGASWLRQGGKEIVGPGVALLWRPLPDPPTESA